MFEQTPYAQAFLKKTAFVPYTQEAMNPPAPQGGDDPNAMPPQDPNAAPPPEQGGAPAQGQMPPIQIVQGPNGEPIDAETGFIVLDQQQGIEQDPLTGILFNKMLGEFATPEGQPLDPNQAMQMIQQAQQQAGAVDPSQQQGQMQDQSQMPPQGGMPEEQGGAPMPPPQDGMPPQGGAVPPQQPPQMGPGQTFDPSTGMMIDDATGLPVDPNTGMLVDPATGQQIDPKTGMPAQQADPNMPFTGDPEVMKAIENVEKNNERTAKSVSSLSHNIGAVRTDIQGLRREFDTFKDQQDQILGQISNFLQVLENAMQGGRR